MNANMRKQINKMQERLPVWMDRKLQRTIMLCLFLALICYLIGVCGVWRRAEEEITQVARPAPGTGSSQEILDMEWENEEGEEGMEQLQVEIGEQLLSTEDKLQLIQEVIGKLPAAILGDNPSPEEITRPLSLMEQLDGYPVTIQWISSQPEYVDWQGNLGVKIPGEGAAVCLTATLTLQGEEVSESFYVTVYPGEHSITEQVSLLLDEASKQEGKWLQLPEKIGDVTLHWRREADNLWKMLAGIFLLAPFIFVAGKKNKAETRSKEERQQMLLDYPEIVSKLTLLLGAGMNLRRAMEQIGQDYLKVKDRKEHKSYQLIVEMCREMEHGVPEREAYEQLGERCGLLQYRTLSSLLIQHLQKGSRGMESLLEEEARKAQEIRQQQAKILGEQASTKLLLPMILMLLVVFVILLVPAWMSFSL